MAGRHDDDELRMTARVRAIVPGDVEADFTIDPPEEADAEYVRRFHTEAEAADAEYVRRFHTEAEARAWLVTMAQQRGLAADDIVWLDV